MRFGIRDVLYTTAGVAVCLAFARFAYTGFVVVFLILNAVLLFCPFAILFTTIVFADQRGQMLDLNTNPFYQDLKKGWLLAVFCSAVIWFVVYTMPFLT